MSTEQTDITELRQDFRLFLRRLARQPWVEIEDQLIDQLRRKVGVGIRHSDVVRLVGAWHLRLRKSLDPETPPGAVLCAFSSVEDTVVQATVGEVEAWANSTPGMPPDA